MSPRFPDGDARAAAGERTRKQFTPWFWSGRLVAKIEAAVVVVVFAGVLAIMVILFQAPGALVVHVADDTHEPIKGARVRCTSPDGATSYAGETDVFGEAKWPGLAKGPWRCEVTPPDRYHGGQQHGVATVAARHPAMWSTIVERPARLSVRIVRPTGAPRAPVAVRAVCPGDPVESWEGRAGLLEGRVLLWLPHGRACRAGLVRPELPYDGPVANPVLDCDAQPCTGVVTGGVGEELSATFTPTVAQWMAVRPALEPDPEPAPKK